MPRKQPSRVQEAEVTQQIDTRNLRTLAEQLRIIQNDVATAKSQAAEAKEANAVLKRQLEQQKQPLSGKI